VTAYVQLTFSSHAERSWIAHGSTTSMDPFNIVIPLSPPFAPMLRAGVVADCVLRAFWEYKKKKHKYKLYRVKFLSFSLRTFNHYPKPPITLGTKVDAHFTKIQEIP